ncbi:thiolase family protein [Specibacter sp. RAF43]|uniref:thiolase family protein n=1 Tax=Specibacter sp. RAF43 TaxID=3233057 RepID=UPI003F996E61
MAEAVILSAVRTAIGTAFKGTLSATTADQLAVPVVTEAIRQSGLDRHLIEDIVFAESLYGGGVLGRYVALEAGLVNVPGLALNRHCAGSLSSLMVAASSIRADADQVVVAGGVQSSSTAPLLRQRSDPAAEWLSLSHRPTDDAPADDMSITVGWNAAKHAGLSRYEQDAWALRSHQRAVQAAASGQFIDEILPLEVMTAECERVTFGADEHPRSNTSLERLSQLGVIHPDIPGFSITAGNASGVNDAAAALVIANSDVARIHGLQPLATIRAWASVGTDPSATGTAPQAAIRKALDRAKLSVEDVDIWEINEAFASVPLAVSRALRLDENIVNPWGSGCSLGHPVAASGARMITTLAHELNRRGGGIAVAAMCAGGGMASAVIIER